MVKILAPVDHAGLRDTNAATPTSSSDLATKGYVDGGAVLYGASGEIILTGTPTGAGSGPGVGRYTNLAGPAQDAHLRSGAAAGSFALVEAQSNGYLTSNLYWDGSNWQRFDTSAHGVRLAALGSLLSYRFLGQAAGANPAVTPYSLLELSSVGALSQLTTPAAHALLTGNSVLHLAANLYFDGTNWNRYQTGLHAILLRLGADSGTIDVYYAAPGANPVSWTRNYTLVYPAGPPVDANSWQVDVLGSGKRMWTKRVYVNSGHPASTVWASMFTLNLPVGVTNLSGIFLTWSWYASVWSRVMQFGHDSALGSTSIVMNGTLGAGPGNWNTISPAIAFDFVAKEV